MENLYLLLEPVVDRVLAILADYISSMPEIIDDKSEHCIPFILDRLKLHREQYEKDGQSPPPFFLGLNGVQGAGKTTLVGEPCWDPSSGIDQLLL